MRGLFGASEAATGCSVEITGAVVPELQQQ
jgi:hypothetical protein